MFWTEEEAVAWLSEEHARGNMAARYEAQWLGSGH